jgi:hypothetical protein
MFTQLAENREDLLKNAGKLKLIVNPLVTPSLNCRKVEHIIIYTNQDFDCAPLSIFRCVVSEMDKWLILEDLTIRKSGVETMKEDSLYVFLGWVIEEAPKWAKKMNKTCVLIQTRLPHCTEWFIEYGYTIRILNDDRGFSGLKQLIDEGRKL